MSSYWTKRRRIYAEVEKILANINDDIIEEVPANDGSIAISQPSVDHTPENVVEDSALLRSDVAGPSNASLHDPAPFVSLANANSDSTFHHSIDDNFDFDSNLKSFSSTIGFVSDKVSCPKQPEKNLSDELANWAVGSNISHSALSGLLCILRNYHPDLPKDARSILKTPRTETTVNSIISVSGGSYFHFGLETGLRQCFDQKPSLLPHCNSITFQLCCDGIPLYKSTNDQFWPLLGMLTTPFRSKPFTIGLFYGKSKPSNLDFMDKFIKEYIKLNRNDGFEYNGINMKVSISAVVCDAPARA